MKRRSRTGGEPARAQRRKTAARKSRIAGKMVRRRTSSAARQETKIARLTRERDEAFRQQTATAGVLKAISRSAFDLEAVLNTLVESAARVCEAERGLILRPTGKNASYYAAASYGHTTEYVEHHKTLTFEPGRGGVSGRVLLEGKSVQIADVLTDPEWAYAEIARLGNFRTILGVPLLREGIPIGIFLLHRTAVRPFTEKQIKLVETFADQAVIAIENTRLFEAEQQRGRELTESLQQQTATADVLKVISRSVFNLQAVLNTLTESAVRLCAADMGIIFQQDGDVFRLAANYGFSPEAVQYAAEHPVPVDRGSTTGRALLEGRAIHIPDVLADPEYRATRYQELAGYRSTLSVPLLRDGTTIGIFALSRTKVNPFTDKQIELATTFADQAVIAIENTRLFEAEQQRTRELAESLEQQTATSEVLQVISSSPGDLQPVFAAMLDKAVRTCDAKTGIIYRREGDGFHLLATHNLPPAYAEARRRSPQHGLSPNSLVGRMVAGKAVVHVADLASEKGYTEQRVPETVTGVELGGVRTALIVPMLKHNDLIGGFSLARQEVRPFNDKQIELVQSFAAQAVIAIENARLLNELRQRTDDLSQRTTDLTEALEQQTATSDVLRVISSSQGELQPVFESILGNAVSVCQAQFGHLLLCEGDAFRNVAMRNAPIALVEKALGQLFRPHPESPLAQAAITKQPVQVHDLMLSQPYLDGHPAVVMTVEVGGTRTLVAVPMLSSGGLLGVIILYRNKVHPFTDKQIDLVKNFAAQAVIAIENARLLNELRERTTDLTESLEQQTATSKVLEVISRSAFDLQAVFETVTENSVRLCEADRAFIWRFDGELLRLAASFNAPAKLKEYIAQNPIRPGRGSTSGRAALERKSINIPDVLVDPEYTYGSKNVEDVHTTLVGTDTKRRRLVGRPGYLSFGGC